MQSTSKLFRSLLLNCCGTPPKKNNDRALRDLGVEGRDREKHRIFYEFSPKRVGTSGGVAYIYIYVYIYIHI